MVVPSQDGCLVFQGAVNSKGYGSVGEGLIHRLAWSEYNGPIPAEWEIHHRCKNKLFCNIDHLDCLGKADHAQLKARPQKLDESRVLALLDALDAGDSRKAVAARFGVSPTTVTDIKHGRSWRRVVRERQERAA
jgi:hypothetical protein